MSWNGGMVLDDNTIPISTILMEWWNGVGEVHTKGTTGNTMMQKTLLWAPC